MIPKIIHYCWFGGKALPNDVKFCIDSWKKYCPDYKIVRWDESNFDINCHPFVKKAYETHNWAFVSDYARLKIVYENGGIYLDTDVELIKNIDFLLNNDSYFGIEQSGHYIATGLGFGAVKENPVVHDMLTVYDTIEFNENNRNNIACPLLNTIPLRKMGYVYKDQIQTVKDVTILPPRYFDPLAPGNSDNLLCEDTISIHHYSASWTPWRQRLKRKIVRIIGDERIIKIREMIK